LNELRKREETFQTRLARLKDDDDDDGIARLNKQIEFVETRIEETRAKLRSLYNNDHYQHSFVENKPSKERTIM